MSLFLAEIVAVFSAPSLVLVLERLFRAITDVSAVPEICHKVHPFLAFVCADWTTKQTTRIRESGIQQGNQIVFQHGLHLIILPVLAVAVLQQ